MKGILFTEPLFHKVVNGTKTQTRRVMKPQPIDPITKENQILYKPRYKSGETLYLKEPYFISAYGELVYKYGNDWENIEWKNKLFMPESYARYFIEITGVRCERLQDISDEDCMKEGILSYGGGQWYAIGEDGDIYSTPQAAYADLIDKINGKGTWERNQFVWVYDFKLPF
jgi:hypothetical protein